MHAPMFLSAFTFIGSYYFENHLCDVMMTHYSTQGHPVALYQCYEMLAFLLATLIIYQQVSLRAEKSGQMWKEVSLVPRPSHCPVCDHLQVIKTGRWEGLETRSLLHNFIHKRLLTTPGHFQSPSQYIQSATPLISTYMTKYH